MNRILYFLLFFGLVNSTWATSLDSIDRSKLTTDQRIRIDEIITTCHQKLNGKLDFKTYTKEGKYCFSQIKCKESGNGGYTDAGQVFGEVCIDESIIFNTAINNNCNGGPCTGGGTTVTTTGGGNTTSGICLHGACQGGSVGGSGKFFAVGPLDIKVYPGSRCYKPCSKWQKKGKKKWLRKCLKCTYGRRLGKCLYKSIRKNRNSCLAKYASHLSMNKDWVSHSTSFSCTHNQSGCPNQQEIYDRVYRYNLGDDCDGDCSRYRDRDGRERRRNRGGNFWPSFFGAAAHLGGTYLTTRSNERVAEKCRSYYETRLYYQEQAELPMDDPDVYNCNGYSTNLFAGFGGYMPNSFGGFGNYYGSAGFSPGYTNAYYGHNQGVAHINPYIGLQNMIPPMNVSIGGAGNYGRFPNAGGFSFQGAGAGNYNYGVNGQYGYTGGNYYQGSSWYGGINGTTGYPYNSGNYGSYWNTGATGANGYNYGRTQQLQYDSKYRDASYYNNSLFNGGGPAYNQMPYMNYGQQYNTPFPY